MSARPIGEIASGIVVRAKRLSIMADFISSFDTAEERKSAVMLLYQGGIITGQSAELFIETFGLEAA